MTTDREWIHLGMTVILAMILATMGVETVAHDHSLDLNHPVGTNDLQHPTIAATAVTPAETIVTSDLHHMRQCEIAVTKQ